MSFTKDDEHGNRPQSKPGATGEPTTFWHAKKGMKSRCAQGIEQLGALPAAQKARAGHDIGTLRDSRWELFGDDTRMMFCTNYDEEWYPYTEAFAEHADDLFQAQRRRSRIA